MKAVYGWILVCLLVFPAVAQANLWRWQQQPVSDATSSYYLTFQQTRNGFYWLGGTAGLQRFDGLSYRTLPFVDRQNREMSISPTVYALAEDQHNRLWIGTTEGLFVLEPNSRQVRPAIVSDTGPVRKLVFHQGRLFAQTFEKGLLAIQTDTPDDEPVTLLARGADIRDISVDDQQLFVLHNDNRITVFSRQSLRKLKSSDCPGAGCERMINQAHQLWLVQADGTVGAMDKMSFDYRQWPLQGEPVVAATALDSNRILMIDKARQLWQVSEGGAPVKAGMLADMKGSPLQGQVREAHADNDGRIWLLGRSANRLYRQSLTAAGFEVSRFNLAGVQQINHIRFDGQGRLLTATDSGLYRQAQFGDEHFRISEVNARHIVHVEPDWLWLFDDNRHLVRLSESGRRGVRHDSERCRKLISFPVFIDRYGDDEWLLFDQQNGVVQLHQGECRPAKAQFEIPRGLDNPVIDAVHKLDEGRYLVSGNWGVFVYLRLEARVTAWDAPNSEPLEFGKAWGNVLLGERDGALFEFQQATGELKPISFKPLPDDPIIAVHSTTAVGLAIGSTKGIYLKDGDTSHFWSFSALTGGRLERKLLAFGGDEMALVSGKRVLRRSLKSLHNDVESLPRAYIDRLYIDGEAEEAGTGQQWPVLALKQSTSRLSLQVSALNKGERRLRFEYRLLGPGQQWRQVDDSRWIHLEPMPSGNYTLQVRSVDGLGNGSAEVAQLQWQIPSTLWYTNLEWMLYGLLLLAALALWLLTHKPRQSALATQLEQPLQNLNEALSALQNQPEKLDELLPGLQQDAAAMAESLKGHGVKRSDGQT